MSPAGYRVGMAQILVEGGRPEANLGRAADAIRDLRPCHGRLLVSSLAVEEVFRDE